MLNKIKEPKMLITLCLGAVVLIVVIAVIAGKIRSPATPLTYDSNNTLQYTDAITGEQTTDLPSEPNNSLPSATIDGISSLDTNLTDNQLQYVQSYLENFLLAHSGLSPVHAGIKDDAISYSGDVSFSFTLVADRPQAQYLVTIILPDQYQDAPSINITQGEE